MAMLGCERLGIDDPKGADRKRLVTFVEIDRCATDAIAVVTGCRLGKRAIKFRDWGKMAATFVDLKPLPPTTKAQSTRPSASPPWSPPSSAPASSIRTSSTRTSSRCSPTARCRTQTSSANSGSASRSHPREMPGYKSARIACESCGEGINYDREVPDSLPARPRQTAVRLPLPVPTTQTRPPVSQPLLPLQLSSSRL
jgi:formylmethanofuran dehydrogenase subunit E